MLLKTYFAQKRCKTHLRSHHHIQNNPVLNSSTTVFTSFLFFLSKHLWQSFFFNHRHLFFFQAKYFDQSFNRFFPSITFGLLFFQLLQNSMLLLGCYIYLSAKRDNIISQLSLLPSLRR